MREQIIRKYVHADNIYSIIGHDYRLYILIAFKYLLLTGILLMVYILAIQPMDQVFLRYIRSGIGLFIYVKLLYEVFDEYLDTLVVTDRGIIHFRRDGLWNQRIDALQWVSIESLSFEQNSLIDSLVNKGDIFIKLEDTVTKFTNVSDPAEVSNIILEFKDRILGRHNYLENEVNHEPDKYNILIEALGEVVTDYVDKKKSENYY